MSGLQQIGDVLWDDYGFVGRVEMTTHTPGPWKWDFDLLGPDEKPILEIGMGYDGQWGGESPNDANARLIAAAPDLLAALKKLADHFEAEMRAHNGIPPLLFNARAAIAKAEGA